MTPCGAVVCTGCATCITAWAETTGLRLQPWQRELVNQYLSTLSTPVDRLLERRPDLAQTAHLGAAIRAGYLESA